MRRNRTISLGLCALLIIWAGIAAFSTASRKPEVKMIYLETTWPNVPNESHPKAVFTIVNSGNKQAHIRMANVARKDGDQWRYDLQSIAILEPSCTVEPRTNRTTSVHFPFNSRPGIWRVEAVVFEPSTKIQTAVFAARRLWARISGKAKYTQFWMPGFTRAYEINSTDVPGLTLNWPPKKVPAPNETEPKEFWSPEFDWTSFGR